MGECFVQSASLVPLWRGDLTLYPLDDESDDDN